MDLVQRRGRIAGWHATGQQSPLGRQAAARATPDEQTQRVHARPRPASFILECQLQSKGTAERSMHL